MFTGQERDAETGLDYFGARYYGGTLGRFSSPDSPFVDQNTHDPQSWNLYSYVRNNPLNRTDPDGRFMILMSGYCIGVAVYCPQLGVTELINPPQPPHVLWAIALEISMCNHGLASEELRQMSLSRTLPAGDVFVRG